MKKRREIEGKEKQEIERKVDREGMKKRGKERGLTWNSKKTFPSKRT